MTSASPAKPKYYLAYLDGVRGGAALWVLVAHCGIWGGWSRLPDPKIAVDIFMIMSGYLMAYHYTARENQEPTNTWLTASKFWVRRFFRIAPLYYLVIAAAFLLAPWVRQGLITLQNANPQAWAKLPFYDPQRVHYTAASFFMHITFLFGLFPQYVRSVFLPDWSIGLEMQFYAVFPLLFLVLRRCGYLLTALAGVVLMVGVHKWFATLPPYCPGAPGVFPEPSFLLLKLPLFLAGMLAAEAHSSFPRTLSQRAFAILLAMFLVSRESVFVLAATALVIYLGASQDNPKEEGAGRIAAVLNRIFANRVTHFMADASYSVYLIHGTFIALIGGFLFQQPQFLRLPPFIRVFFLTMLVAACAYLLAYLLSRWLEKPGIQIGRRIINKMERVPKIQPIPAAITVAATSKAD